MKKKMGIIGGSGLYNMEGLIQKEEITVDTPFGEPSDVFMSGIFEGKEVVFLARHGKGHQFMPSEINYRANIWAMKSLGVEWILSVSAVGSFKKELAPRDIVLVDQFFDRTFKRENTFFGNGITAHVMFSHPTCEDLRKIIYKGAQDAGLSNRVHQRGVYLNMEGPAFSTQAESLLFKSWNIDVIGMTNITEARLAREAEICFATIALVTDYDCWIEDEPDSSVNVEMVLENIRSNISNAKSILANSIRQIPDERHCQCKESLKNAIITAPECIPGHARKKLDILIGKYIK